MNSSSVELIKLHPRVAQQGVAEDRVRQVLVQALDRIVPFDRHTVHGGAALLDWDHRLPSRALTLRLHLCYEAKALDELQLAVGKRNQEIAARDLFPEFDVPDFGGLPSDESYDIELTPELLVEGIRLVSPWRRDVADHHASRAISAVRQSEQFGQVRIDDPSRPVSLGDLEAVAWTPPCESGHPAWTLDVWWLTSFDGRIGKGWSFLVDLDGEEGKVMTAREFSVRAS